MSNLNQILREELKPMQQMQMARTPQRCSNPSLPSSNKATKAIGGTREEESKRDKILQNLDPQRCTHKEMNRLGQNVDLDHLHQPLKYMQESMKGCVEIKLKE